MCVSKDSQYRYVCVLCGAVVRFSEQCARFWCMREKSTHGKKNNQQLTKAIAEISICIIFFLFLFLRLVLFHFFVLALCCAFFRVSRLCFLLLLLLWMIFGLLSSIVYPMPTCSHLLVFRSVCILTKLIGFFFSVGSLTPSRTFAQSQLFSVRILCASCCCNC